MQFEYPSLDNTGGLLRIQIKQGVKKVWQYMPVISRALYRYNPVTIYYYSFSGLSCRDCLLIQNVTDFSSWAAVTIW